MSFSSSRDAPYATEAPLRFALIICLKDLRRRLRDRTAVLVAVVAPLLLSALVGLALGSNDAGIEVRLALVDLDGGPDAVALREFLARPWLEGVVLLEEVDSVAEASLILEDDDADVALVVYPGFAGAQTSGPAGTQSTAPTGLEVIASGHNPFATRMTIGLGERFLTLTRAAEISVSPESIAQIVPISPGGKLRTVDYYAFSMSVLFLTFTVLSGVRAFQEEVDAGVIARLVASPASGRALMGGKLLGLLLLGWLQMSVMIAATSLLFGTAWGHPLTVTCLVFTSVWMATGMTAFFMSVAPNAEQGQMLASISIFVLAVIGGQFMPAQGLPDIFDTLQRLTPNGQAARGFMDAAALHSTGGLANLLEPLLFTFVVGTAGIVFAARRASAALEHSL
jgi:ABC-2 type transport system permease protein